MDLTAVEVDRAINTALDAISLQGKMPVDIALRLSRAINELQHAAVLSFQWRDAEHRREAAQRGEEPPEFSSGREGE